MNQSDTPADQIHTCAVCPEEAVVRCVHCGQGRCEETDHLYDAFITRRYGTMADQVGSRFFYHCPNCDGMLCVDCLGLRDGYPCDLEAIQFHPFVCPTCGSRIAVLRGDHLDPSEAAEALCEFLSEKDYLTDAIGPMESCREPHTLKQLQPRTLTHIPFGPRPRPLWPGEVWQTLFIPDTGADPPVQLIITCADHPEPTVQIIYAHEQDRHLICTLGPDEVWYGDGLQELTGWPISCSRPFALAADHNGVTIVVLDDMESMVDKLGIWRYPPPAPLARKAARVSISPADQSANPFAPQLKALTDKAIWDYEWLECPKPEAYGPDAVLAVAGSTDLMYYHLVRVIFEGVRYTNCPNYFSHPLFRPATSTETHLLRDLASFGPDSQAFCIHGGFGGAFAQLSYIVADQVLMQDENLDAPYTARNSDHEDWWWKKADEDG